MLKYVGKRLIQGLLLLALFLALLYLLLEAQPGDITQQLIANPQLPPEAQTMLRERLGLDQPLMGRTFNYVVNFFQGDLGLSFTQYPNTVGQLILERLPRTVTLFLTATLLSYYLGFALGKIMAWKRGRTFETALTLGGVAGYTVFYPWFAILMLWLFGFALNWFPLGKFIDVQEWTGSALTANQLFIRILLTAVAASVLVLAIHIVSRRVSSRDVGGRVRAIGTPLVVVAYVLYWWLSPHRDLVGDLLHHTALPVITLSAVNFAGVMLLTRSSMLETLREDYILTARAKGLTERAIRNDHAARNALLPVVTSLVLALSFVIGGGILTEGIFSWPGLGQMLLNATLLEDLPLATGTLGIIGILALTGHIIADIVYMYLDPESATDKELAVADILTAPPIPSGQAPESILEEPLWKIRLRLTRRSIAQNWKLFVANKIGLIGLGMIGVFAVMAISHPILMATVWEPAVYNPITGYHAVKVDKLVVDVVNDPTTEVDLATAMIQSNPFIEVGDTLSIPQQPAPPSLGVRAGTDRNGAEVSASHILGTDPLGRDILSQLLYSTRAAFFLGIIAAVVTVFIATAIGSISAYFGGWIDTVLMRFADLILLVPPIPVLIVVSALFRISLPLLGLLIGLLGGFGGTAIILKSQALQVSVKPFIDAARIAGGGHTHLIFRHIVPNVLPLSFLYMMFTVTEAISLEAILSFLGLLSIPMSWGIMINVAQTQGYFLSGTDYWWLLIPAGLAVSLLCASFFLVGRAMDEVVNPRLRQR